MNKNTRHRIQSGNLDLVEKVKKNDAIKNWQAGKEESITVMQIQLKKYPWFTRYRREAGMIYSLGDGQHGGTAGLMHIKEELAWMEPIFASLQATQPDICQTE